MVWSVQTETISLDILCILFLHFRKRATLVLISAAAIVRSPPAQLHLVSRFALIRFRPLLGMRAGACASTRTDSAAASSIFRRRREQCRSCNPPSRACGRTYTHVCLCPHEVYLLAAERSYRSDYHARLTRVSTTICSPTWIARFDIATFVRREPMSLFLRPSEFLRAFFSVRFLIKYIDWLLQLSNKTNHSLLILLHIT